MIKKLLGSNIVQQSMSAGEALQIGLLTDGAEGCGWFTDWARKSPNDEVHLYSFGGFIGGFIYGESANFETLAEFAQCAEDSAAKVWSELQCQ